MLTPTSSDEQLSASGKPSMPVWIYPADNETSVSEGAAIPWKDIGDALKKHQWLLAGITVLAAALGIVVALTSTKVYFSETSLLPVSEQRSGIGQFLPGLGGMASLIGASSNPQSSNIMTILKTRSFREAVIQRLDLMPVIFDGYDSASEEQSLLLSDGAQVLKARVQISQDAATGVIGIGVSWPEDPQMAATIANAYSEELDVYLSHNAISKAQENRKFIENQLSLAENELSTYEAQLKAFSEKYKMLDPQEQMTLLNQALTGLKTNLMNKKIEATLLPQNTPKASFFREQIQAIQQEIAKLEHGSQSQTSGEALFAVSLEQFPGVMLEYIRLKRKLTAKQEVYKVLIGQLETSKIDEAKEKSLFQVLDSAIVPRNPIKPNKKLIVILITILGMLLGLGGVFIYEYRQGQNPTL